jgi:hypothetical protein
MHVSYKDFEIDIFDDQLYDPASNDNINHYNRVYNNTGPHQRTAAHGIRVYKNDNEISSAIILRTGASTIIHSRAFIIKNNILFLCCSSAVCAFSLPSLNLKWEQEFDTATCFEIYEYQDDFIHGECEISRITTDGILKWQFGGRDIFVTINGDDNFEITSNNIIAHDFQGYKYVISGDGELIG